MVLVWKSSTKCQNLPFCLRTVEMLPGGYAWIRYHLSLERGIRCIPTVGIGWRRPSGWSGEGRRGGGGRCCPRGLSGQLRFTHRFWPLQPRAGTGSSVSVVPGRCSHAVLGAWVRSETFQLRAFNETSIDVKKNVENKRLKLSGSTLHPWNHQFIQT